MILGVPVPVVAIALGVVFLIAALKVLIQQRRIVEVVPQSNFNLNLPTRWDDGEISRLLQRYSDQPPVLAHAVSSIKQRMVLNQDIKTAQKRLKLIASVIEVFRLNRELQGILHDLHLQEKEFEIQQVESQIRREDADTRLKSERTLRDLRRQRDELQLNREIVQLKQDIRGADNSGSQAPKMTQEEQRVRDKAACEKRIQSLKEEKQKALELDEADERVLRVNAIDDAIQREMERWSKLL